MQVYKAISDVQKALAEIGIGKGRKNSAQGYNFRGIDDVLQALAPLLSQCGLVVIPRVLSCSRETVVNAKGTTLFYVTVDVEYDLIGVGDGSKHTARILGEAMDSGDKATNKAMSAAYKYFALQTFCIPVEGVAIDSEQDSHEVAAPSYGEHEHNAALGAISKASKQETIDKIVMRAIELNAPENRINHLRDAGMKRIAALTEDIPQ
jgi:hypothetical protein